MDGVYQQKDSYTVSGTTLTFDAAPANNVEIEVMSFTQTTLNAPAANTVGVAELNLSDGTSGQVLTTDGSGTLSFADGGVAGISSSADATAITIDSDENVGIGESSPAAILEVSGGSADYDPSATGTGLFHVKGGATSLYSGYIGISDSGMSLGHNGSGSRYLRFDTNEIERMRINASGVVTKPSHPCFDVSTTTAPLSTGTIVFNTVNIDRGSNYNNTNGRFTAPVTGSYLFYTQYIKNNITNTVCRRNFDVNGVNVLGGREIRLDSGSPYNYGSMTIILYLQATDYVTVNQSAGAAHGGLTYEAFGGHLIG
jgi:hypothetical protein